MQTAEQLFQHIQKLPDKEKQQLLCMIQRAGSMLADDDQWEKARLAIHQVAGSMDLGEQLGNILDRETVYQERFE